MLTVFFLLATLTFLSGAIFCGYMLLPGGSPKVYERLLQITKLGAEPLREESRMARIAGVSARLTGWIHSHIGLRIDPQLQGRFIRAGLKVGPAGEIYQSALLLGPIATMVASFAIPSARVFWVMTLPALAYLAPAIILGQLVRRRRALIRSSIPDVIDLLVICVDAGLGIDQAMLRVGQELSLSHPAMNQEILHINREQRAGRPRGEAWQGMAERVNIAEIDGLVGMLLQTERFGTPISKALATFAAGIRVKRRQSAEESAAKSTIKIIFPLVFFIFPPIFIVLLGPAVLNIVRLLGNSK